MISFFEKSENCLMIAYNLTSDTVFSVSNSWFSFAKSMIFLKVKKTKSMSTTDKTHFFWRCVVVKGTEKIATWEMTLKGIRNDPKVDPNCIQLPNFSETLSVRMDQLWKKSWGNTELFTELFWNTFDQNGSTLKEVLREHGAFHRTFLKNLCFTAQQQHLTSLTESTSLN